jgi:hypothetical protein
MTASLEILARFPIGLIALINFPNNNKRRTRRLSTFLIIPTNHQFQAYLGKFPNKNYKFIVMPLPMMSMFHKPPYHPEKRHRWNRQKVFSAE